MSSHSIHPAFDHVRLATLSDLPRIATVAAAGFFHSPTFQFQRPYYAQFVEDTLSSYWKEYHQEIQDAAVVVLVVEDLWDDSEHDSAYEALRTSPSYCARNGSQGRVVVGVCSIDLKPGSWRIGRFQPQINEELLQLYSAPNGLIRDMSPVAIKIYGEATAPAKAKYLAGNMRLSTLAVHPAYWQRGHATRLVSWCTSLADMDDVPIGVSAAPMGAAVAAKAGFEERETVRIRRSEVPAVPVPPNDAMVGDVELWIAIRPPSHSPSDSGTVSSESPVGDLKP
ncbi:hypothetical protein B0J11DRAFT_103544 [Dendryphion nanum]|uniref:N-acetyltransferase domain-containing protein n=1 Tax=Dendryphion nanum TaxID=256645 RepID=A0A9P9IEI2_9PLEO|nr:hypothetical protein B0J11DRAFT_103544 [Dendryphion nanum]